MPSRRSASPSTSGRSVRSAAPTPSARRRLSQPSCVPASQQEPSDVPLMWNGELVAAVRMPPLHGALDRLIDTVEAELGAPLPSLSREDKQRAVRLLDEKGAFILRRAVEDVADAMGVSRITVYNYLNAIHR